MSKKENKSSYSKRKMRSDVWDHFTKYENKDKKSRALCQHCKKDFDGSSKSGTTHLRNHIRSCLKNPNKVIDKAKEIVVVDQELNDSNLVQNMITHGLNGIKDDILEVYKQKKNKLYRYLEELPRHFNISIGRLLLDDPVWYVMIWFIDNNWKLKNWIIHLKEDDFAISRRINEHFLMWLLQDWNIDKRILSIFDPRGGLLDDSKLQLTSLLNERASHRFMGTFDGYFFSRDYFFDAGSVLWESDIMVKVGKLRDYCMTSSSKYKFEFVVKKAESMGKKVTLEIFALGVPYKFSPLDWAMRNKEVFCELEHIDPDFKSINFDWEDAAFLHNICTLLMDLENHFWKMRFSEFKLANECFPLVYQSFLKMRQLKNTEYQYFCLVALLWREIFDKLCNNLKLVLVITVILDPRFKQDDVQHFYKEIYDDEADLHFNQIMGDVTNIYNEYAKDVNNSPQHSDEVASSKSEFRRYLTDSKVPPCEEFDILEWWRLNSSTYPTLAMMACDFLSISFVYADGDGIDITNRLGDKVFNIFSFHCLDADLKYAIACTKAWLTEFESL
ncbi:zinc finger BED domain-containing protein RICESLEEPER 1-like isoform X1 [Mangifera indica]|uniref:zinc finger BED domain-containing protein RICESLEEPER 1-like isoform X1 n=1 Tax=Mangifera indica TaxID=29780 RepID=UPI001CFB6BAA|nr:zinc finger BED domain-containing protein RICESLEEPER 1-like isoform X1 [Mangifera indica]XP_044465621.1 zinc finger BED domain-containing protein RICESLEEPER 1-like isoform X1 [Mangifera indica]